MKVEAIIHGDDDRQWGLGCSLDEYNWDMYFDKYVRVLKETIRAIKAGEINELQEGR